MLGRGPVLLFLPILYFDFFNFAACAKTEWTVLLGPVSVDNVWTCLSPFLPYTDSLGLDIWTLAGPFKGQGWGTVIGIHG